MNADIRIATDIGEHRKIRLLAKELKIPRAQAVGHMVLLWSKVAIFKPDGNITGWDAEDLAEFSGFPIKKAELFHSFLKSTNFLDVDEVSGEMRLHNWNSRNSYAAKSPERSSQSSRAANLRWVREKCNKKCNGEYTDSCLENCPEHCRQHCPFHTDSIAPLPPPSPLPLPSLFSSLLLPPLTSSLPENGSGGGSSKIFELYNKIIGVPTEKICEDFDYYQHECESEWIENVFDLVEEIKPDRPWRYAKATLDTWIEKGEMILRKNGAQGTGSESGMTLKNQKIELVCAACGNVAEHLLSNIEVNFILERKSTDIAALKYSPCGKCGEAKGYKLKSERE